MPATERRIPLVETITSRDPALRDRSVRDLIAGASTAEILDACRELESFRRTSGNLYERVRASIFLHAIYRYAIQEAPDLPSTGLIPFDGFTDLMERRFEQAVSVFLAEQDRRGPDSARQRWRRPTSR